MRPVTVNVRVLIAAAGAGLLVLAVFDLPYGYYSFLRLAVTAGTIALLVLLRGEAPGWLIGLAVVALLWNPVFPVPLSSEAWLPLDLLGAAFMGVLAYRAARPGLDCTSESS